MKTPAFIFAGILAVASLASAIPNPAAVFCAKCGYRYEIRTDPQGGQYGVCVFPDGSECDEWAYFRKCNASQTCGDCNCPWPCPKRIIYVDDDANGLNDGSSWLNAYNYLQDALSDADSATKPVEIRVAQGIYRPDEDTLHPDGTGDRTATFQLINGVTIKGGYAGFGEADPNARDTVLYQAILSGDIGKPLNKIDNCYHIFYHPEGLNLDETAILDGFTITGGNANGDWPHYTGGGMCNYKNSPTVTNCAFSGNSANSGGGMYNYNQSSPNVNNCTFSENSADLGGGIWNADSSMATVEGCTFSENLAERSGGGMFTGGKPTIINCIFSGNSAGERGGGMYIACGTAMLTNCTFAGNLAQNGKALGCEREVLGTGGNMQGINCILWDGGDEIFKQSGSKVDITYSDIQGVWPGEGNIDADPCFAEPGYWDPNRTPDDANDDFWVNGDYHLKAQAGRWDANEGRWMIDEVTSLCIDAGDPASPVGLEPFPNGGIINMGAYGGTAEASKSYFGKPICETIVAGDINGDCIVDFKDLALMAFHWLEER